MNPKIRKNIYTSVLSYFIFGGLVFVQGVEFLTTHKYIIVPLFTALLIRDIVQFAYTSTPTRGKKLALWNILSDYKDSSLSFIQVFYIINRNYLFPAFLFLYIWLQIFAEIWNYSVSINNKLLLVGIVLGFCIIFNNHLDEKYMKTNTWKPYFYITLSVLLSAITTVLILNQTSSLWFMSYGISIAWGVLLFLVWISILKEEDEEKIYTKTI